MTKMWTIIRRVPGTDDKFYFSLRAGIEGWVADKQYAVRFNRSEDAQAQVKALTLGNGEAFEEEFE